MPNLTPDTKQPILVSVYLTVALPLIALAIGIYQIALNIVGYFEWVTLITLYLITMIGLEMGFHRLLSHHSFQTHKPIAIGLMILGALSAQGQPFHWICHHRIHHKHTDDEHDPHSPHLHLAQSSFSNKLKGLYHAHIGWLFSRPSADYMHCRDLIADKAYVAVNEHYLLWVLLGLLIPGLVGVIVFEEALYGFGQGVLWGGFIRICLVQHAVWAINSIGHAFGSQPYKANAQQKLNQYDQSKNNFVLALLTLGGGWHNNHHHFPSSAIVGFKAWQVDLVGGLIKTMAWMGLAWNVRYPRLKHKNIHVDHPTKREKEDRLYEPKCEFY